MRGQGRDKQLTGLRGFCSSLYHRDEGGKVVSFREVVDGVINGELAECCCSCLPPD